MIVGERKSLKNDISYSDQTPSNVYVTLSTLLNVDLGKERSIYRISDTLNRVSFCLII